MCKLCSFGECCVMCLLLMCLLIGTKRWSVCVYPGEGKNIHTFDTHTLRVPFGVYVGGGGGWLYFEEVASRLVFGASVCPRVGNICMCVSIGV